MAGRGAVHCHHSPLAEVAGLAVVRLATAASVAGAGEVVRRGSEVCHHCGYLDHSTDNSSAATAKFIRSGLRPSYSRARVSLRYCPGVSFQTRVVCCGTKQTLCMCAGGHFSCVRRFRGIGWSAGCAATRLEATTPTASRLSALYAMYAGRNPAVRANAVCLFDSLFAVPADGTEICMYAAVCTAGVSSNACASVVDCGSSVSSIARFWVV